ncbi:hypothetical protein ACIRF8_31585 [Streptomyces sp. NPDC102406]|uniref:hypothetical protein n=1 Tax=Streptomyces sp. NPDC102406 TaxID=3366171 RepID=UPI0037F1E62B
MTFHQHLQHLAESALASIPAAEAADIYVVSFSIDDEDDDPRRPALTIGYNTHLLPTRPQPPRDLCHRKVRRDRHVPVIQGLVPG